MLKNVDFDILVIRDYYPSVNNPSSSTWVYNQVASLQEMGYKPLVISPAPFNPLKKIFRERFQLYDNPSLEYENYLNTTVIRPPYFKVPRNKLKGTTLHCLSKVILKYGNLNSIKLIHAHFGQNGVAALSLKENLRVPLITSFYGFDSGRLGQLFKPYYKDLISKGDLFLALSDNMKSDLLKLGFPEEKILIHRLGIDTSRFDVHSATGNEFIMLTVARLDETKGVQYVIKALHQFFQLHPDTKKKIIYKIVGGGSYESELKKLVSNLNLSDQIVFFNNLLVKNGREIVISEMQNCDIFLLCSSTIKSGGKEGTPVVLMEAQACGKPCISTFHAGIPEVVLNNKTGILVNERSVEEIKNAISLMYFDSEKRKSFGENAREHILSVYNQSKRMAELKQLYDRFIKSE